MKKVFMFVNVDWFFLSHRLPIAEVAADKGIDMTVFTDFTKSHDETYNGFTLQRVLLHELWEVFSLYLKSFFSYFVL